ncbi:CBS domain-containing protein [Halalkalibacter sp. APA_J-10(15)]|uniref:CBS domain-containing protein n=1 Tax=unclassified Halalkalibacter TaxID=2893063 RepID=UPI001FF5DF8F|nr:CBS domain-containing protein [Halalkalibacter sp. APA_J-10(15)]MCK0473115.1 CBS domain-containing protein [Halalkalibacter sp. APA_J-10(15)]
MNTISECMSTNIVTINPDQTIQEAADLMKQYDIGSIPVVEADQLIGIVTDRDITLRSTASGADAHVPVKDCMTTNITVASPNTDIHEAANLMSEHQIRRLPIVENNQLVGMVSIGDLALDHQLVNEAGQTLSSISEHEHRS